MSGSSTHGNTKDYMPLKCLLLNKPSINSYSVPYFYASAKTYYEENSAHADKWEWISPFLDYSTADSIIEYVLKHQPDVLGFSLYVWNEKLFNDVAQKIKQLNEKIIIIFGGPQCDLKYNKNFFLEKPYVDMVVPGDAYGEIILHQLLDSIVENNGSIDQSKIPYSYFPGPNREIIFNDIPIDKKGFKWPQNVYAAQEDVMLQFLSAMESPRWIMVETSRGCPYKCAFCDWGGGIYTKTNKKDFSIVLSELEWFGKQQIDALFVTDANFGLFDIDIEYTRQLIKVKEKYGFPKRATIQPTKSKLENLYTIYKLLADAELLYYYKIAVEDLNDHVLKNIDRIDFSFDDKMEMVRRLQENKKLGVFVEGIMGLPGASLETMKTDIQKIVDYDLDFPINHAWMLLPETPAYAKEYREKFKLVTVKNKDYSSNVQFPLRLKKNFKADEGVWHAIDNDQTTTEFVIGTMSYTPDDWVKMNILQTFISSTYNTNILKLIPKYLHKEHGITHGEFFFYLLDNMFFNEQLYPELAKIKDSIKNWMHGNSINVFVDYAEDFPYEISPSNYILFIILTQPDKFFNIVSDLLIDKTSDEKIKDLCHFIKNNLITIDYVTGKVFETKYDWVTYKESGILNQISKKYVVTDTKVHLTGNDLPIDWDLYPDNRLTHFFYRLCYDIKSNKLVKQLEEISEEK